MSGYDTETSVFGKYVETVSQKLNIETFPKQIIRRIEIWVVIASVSIGFIYVL